MNAPDWFLPVQRPRTKNSRSVCHPATATSDPVFLALIERARFLDALDSELRDALPPQLASRCRLANAYDTRLVFLASSSLVAARLRLLQNELLQCANRKSGVRYEKLTVKVAPVPPVPPETAPQKPLSNAAASHLTQAARLLADPELRDLFLRLASLA